MVSIPARAGETRTQRVELKAGWNAVSIDVDPLDSAPGTVFDSTKVDIVARYFTPRTPVRFIADPEEQAWNAPGWGVWYAADRAEAFLTSLHAIHGGSAYLVHARQDCALNVAGAVNFRRLQWTTDSFNLTGFPVEAGATITFAKFFAGSSGRIGSRIYRLVEGSWQKITDPATTVIRPGEACWVYCEGSTTYQGPLDLRFHGRELDFGANSSQVVLEYANRIDTPFSVQVAVESNTGLPLYRGVLDLAAGTSTAVSLAGGANLGSVPGGGVNHLNLELRRELMTGISGSAILKFTTTDGVVLRIPVAASMP
ncbi:MAG: hypothetical protein H7A55_13725 [Verrucomicrobiaceae bacterium]|nr:hypothetical protein [Verrucomicrobiaceae bacterium]